MSGVNDSIQFGANPTPDNALPNKSRLIYNGVSWGQVSPTGEIRLFASIGRRDETDNTTITLADVGNQLTIDSGVAKTVTVPLDATLLFQDNDAIQIAQFGVGVVSIDPVAGVFINGVDDTPIELVGGAFVGTATLQRIGVNTWWLYGAI